MRGTLVLVAGFFALVMPAWANGVPGATALPLPNVSLLPGPGLDAGLPRPGLPPKAVIPAVDLSADDFIDTIPLISMDIPAVTLPVRLDLMLEESVVGLDSIDGVGVMVSWGKGHPPA